MIVSFALAEMTEVLVGLEPEAIRTFVERFNIQFAPDHAMGFQEDKTYRIWLMELPLKTMVITRNWKPGDKASREAIALKEPLAQL